ncbi:MAG: S41 family peptidase [Promethearchaeati archaeon]
MDSQDIDLSLRIFILSKTYSAINTYFAHWKSIPELEIDTLYNMIIPRITRTSNRYEFDLIMMEFFSHLQNGHTWYKDNWLELEYGKNFDFTFTYLKDKWVITSSKESELSPGDIIASINNEDFNAFFGRMEKYISASSKRAKRNKFYSFNFLFPKQFSIILEDGKNVEIKQVRKKNSSGSKIDPLKPTQTSIQDKDIVYIKIPSFGLPKYEREVIQFLELSLDSKALIIDVRKNSGGSTPIKLISNLMDRPYRSWSVSTKLSIGVFRYYSEFFKRLLDKHDPLNEGYSEIYNKFQQYSYFQDPHMLWYSTYEKPIKECYKGKIAILTDGMTGSAAEDFVQPFKDNKRAIIIGEKTKGTTGEPYQYSFDNGITIYVGAKRAYFPDGSEFEGVGISPDIEIIPTIESLRRKEDIVLERAISELS